MVYINPQAIPNSGNTEYFTNQKSKISKIILNIIDNADNLNNFLVKQFNNQQKTNSSLPINSSINDNDFKIILQNQRNTSKFNNFKY